MKSPISLFTWLNHRWLIPPALSLLSPIVVWYYAGLAAMIWTCYGIIVGIVIALNVRKWRELN